MEQIQILEEKLQSAFNENAKLKVKQKEDEKLWNVLESKLGSTKTMCNQLSGTLQQLSAQVQNGKCSSHIQCVIWNIRDIFAVVLILDFHSRER